MSIRLQLDPDTDTISGRIDGGDPFNGWLQLAAALQHILTEPGDEAQPQRED